jgi:hypothetical protein
MKILHCYDCGRAIEMSSGVIIVRCEGCGAIYVSNETLYLQLSGKNTVEEARLNFDSIIKAIVNYQEQMMAGKKEG